MDSELYRRLAEARLEELRREARAASLAVGYRQSDRRVAREADGLHRLGPPPEEEFLERIAGKLERQNIAEEVASHIVVTELSDRVGFALLRLAEERVELDVSEADLPRAGGERATPTEMVDLLPGVAVADAGGRAYPFDFFTVAIDRTGFPGPLRSESPLEVVVRGVACHLVGSVRGGIHGEDVERRAKRVKSDAAFAARVAAGADRGRYLDGDSVGDWGVEASREDELRGLRGLTTHHLDSGVTEEVAPTAGLDVRLTIDAVLQARVQGVMSPAAQPLSAPLQDGIRFLHRPVPAAPSADFAARFPRGRRATGLSCSA